MGDLDRPEDRQEEQQEEEEETSFGEEDRRDESMVIIDKSNPNANVRRNLDAMKEANRYLGRGISVKNFEYTLGKEKISQRNGYKCRKERRTFLECRARKVKFDKEQKRSARWRV